MSSHEDRKRRERRINGLSRQRSLLLLRQGQRELWHEERAHGQSRFVVRYRGAIEQQGSTRATREAGTERQCGAVRMHVLIVADALEAAYASRCRMGDPGAWT